MQPGHQLLGEPWAPSGAVPDVKDTNQTGMQRVHRAWPVIALCSRMVSLSALA